MIQKLRHKFCRNVFLSLLYLCTYFFSVSYVNAQQTSVNAVQATGSQDVTTQSVAPSNATKNNQSTGQSPVLIIKKNAGVSSVVSGWAVGQQNTDTTVSVPTRDLQGGSSSSVSMKKNPTGTNVKNNQSALTQPPTIVISLPTCTGGQVLVGNVCACTGANVWDGSSCVAPVTCASIKPSDTSSSQTCTAYYSSPAWSGNVTTNITWTCPSTYGAPVNATTVNTSGCTALTTCASRLPANSSTSQTCSSYYGNSGYLGNVFTNITWSCPSTYGNPTSSSSLNTSACVLQPITCTAGTVSTSSACTSPFVGGSQITTTTTTCPSGQYGAPSTSSSLNTSGCVSCTFSSGSDSSACSAGYSGTRYRTTSTNSCTGAVTYGAWDTSSCVACTNTAGVDSSSCGAGYSSSSTRTRTTSTNSCTGAVSYGAWDTSSCVACTSSGSTETVACIYSGTKTRTVTTNTCSATTYGAWDTSSCDVCPSTAGVDSSSCGAGYSGTRTRTTSTNSCTGAVTYGAWNTSSCAVLNPITYTDWTFFTTDSADPSRCSKQTWLLGYQNGVKVSETMIAYDAGFIDSDGTCVLY